MAVAFAGGATAYALGIPGNWFVGAMLATILFAMSGRSVIFPATLRDAMLIGLGLIFGAGMTGDTFADIARWPVSMFLVLVNLVLIVALSMLYFVYIAKWDRISAMLASVPGALTHVMVLAEETKADVARVAVSQSTRIILLGAIIPIFFSGNGDSATTPMAAQIPVSVRDTAILIVGGVLAAGLFTLLRIPGAKIIGPTFASALLFANGIVGGAFQSWQIVPFFVLLGMMIGARLSGISLSLIKQYLLSSIGAFLLVFLVSAAAAAAASALTGIPFGLAMLAFAPGAFEAMAALALVLDQDPAFVIAHHLVRYFGIILMTPVFLAIASKSSTKDQNDK